MNLLATLKGLGGFWQYAGGPYLAELTSGRISDKYINMSKLMCKPLLLHLACCDLRKKFEAVREEHDSTNLYVCGPAMGGVTFAYEMARHLGATAAIFTEPTYEIDSEVHVPIPGQDPIKKTGQELKRFDIPPYRSSILFCEDVINTGRSTYEMMDAVHKARGTAQGTLPYVLCLVNRSGRTALNGIDGRGELEIISLADVTAKTWGKLEDAVDDICPVTSHAECRNSDCEYREVKGTDVACGMEAVRPKDNWEKLTAEDKE